MPTANELYRDAALRHQVGIRRYGSGVVKRVAVLLEEADRELTAMLRDRLSRFEGRVPDFTSQRWQALLADVRAARQIAVQEYKDLVQSELAAFGALEGSREISLLSSAIPIEVSFAAVDANQLKTIATSRPFQGKFLREWFLELEQGDRRWLEQALQLGMTEGEPIDDIVRRVVGTRRSNYTDGILSLTRRNAQTIVRTAVNHVSNVARDVVWEENADVVGAKIWSSTLDGRTSAICRARDGRGTPLGGRELPPGVLPLSPPGARPPAHLGCRSSLVGWIDGVGLLGRRPTVTDTRTRARREIDFRAEARRRGVPIQQVRKEWAAKHIGGVPADVTYQEWLSKQPAKFQDEVLGKTKGALFRRGEVGLDHFVDRSGNELTLSQLAKTRPEAFQAAGLSTSDF